MIAAAASLTLIAAAPRALAVASAQAAPPQVLMPDATGAIAAWARQK